MATAEKTTREQVEELFDQGVTDAGEIAEHVGKTPATVYVHLRKIQNERGMKPRGRGRPPKVQSGDGAKSTTAPRKAPPKAGGKSGAKATPAKATTAPATPAAKPAAEPKSNGHVTMGDRFPDIKRSIEHTLKERQREVATLEKMLASLES